LAGASTMSTFHATTETSACCFRAVLTIISISFNTVFRLDRHPELA
jgi:hypothetical protein